MMAARDRGGSWLIARDEEPRELSPRAKPGVNAPEVRKHALRQPARVGRSPAGGGWRRIWCTSGAPALGAVLAGAVALPRCRHGPPRSELVQHAGQLLPLAARAPQPGA